jgi:hypothetical protein
MANFYGNYFIRGTDLLALPNCTPDSVFGIEFAYDEQVRNLRSLSTYVDYIRVCYCCIYIILLCDFVLQVLFKCLV